MPMCRPFSSTSSPASTAATGWPRAWCRRSRRTRSTSLSWCGLPAPMSRRAAKFSPARACRSSVPRLSPRRHSAPSQPGGTMSKASATSDQAAGQQGTGRPMTILIDRSPRVLVQGITGKIGAFHTQEMIEYGPLIVGGVTPGKSGTRQAGVPVFDTVKQAVDETQATASVVFVPPPFAADAIMEAADAGIKLCVAITDGIPAQDMIRVKRYMRRYARENRMQLIGPNCAGVISPGKALLGIMPGHIYMRGNVGLVTRSGTLGYEAASQMKDVGIGITTSVGIGGDPINGSSFLDHLKLFEQDPETDA